jgi:hypothetical protein
MTLAPDKAALLGDIVSALTGVSGIRAIALGGSHARGTHHADSDLDIGLYYRADDPLDIDAVRAVAKRFSRASAPVVTGLWAWGPFVNGGAWIDNPVCKIDFLYRELDQLERILADALQGEWTHSYDQQPPFGFRSVTTLGEIHICKPQYDPENSLAPLKSALAVYPPALKTRIVQDMLWNAQFSFRFGRDFAAAGDVPNSVASMARIFHCLVQALYALNETWFLNDKRDLPEIAGFERIPENFDDRISAILATPGPTVGALNASLDALQTLFEETVALSDGMYVAKF